MDIYSLSFYFVYIFLYLINGEKIALPDFKKLKAFYPGHKHYGGHFSHRSLKKMIGITEKRFMHGTTALRLSYAMNKIGGRHSLGSELIRLSKAGHDSISGKTGLQYIFNPIAFGPYLADKYGYPNVSILHQTDPLATTKRFYGRQGILEIITYTRRGNKPKGHIVLWDCNHIYQAKDLITKHHLITVEFWQSPDSNCHSNNVEREDTRQLQPVSFGTSRLDTVRYLKSKYRHQKVITMVRNNKTYKKVSFDNSVL